MSLSARDVLAVKTANALTPVVGAAAGVAADKILSMLPGNLKATSPALYAALVGAAVTTAVQVISHPQQEEQPQPAGPWILPGYTV